MRGWLSGKRGVTGPVFRLGYPPSEGAAKKTWVSHARRPRPYLVATGGKVDPGVLAHLVKCMLSVVREGPNLGRPTALFDCLGPFRADKNVRAINLVHCAIARALMCYLLLNAADAQGKGLSRHSRHSAHTGNLEKIGDMFGIVDLVEERLFVSINIHVHHKEVP
jgi:hypothetical protein